MILKQRFNAWRWKQYSSGYVFDKLIFNIAMYIIFLYLFIVCYQADFNFGNQIYIKCNEKIGCENPFYKGDDIDLSIEYTDEAKEYCVWDWCNEPVLYYGFEFGKKPSWMFNNAFLFSLVVMLSAFGINHWRYNREGKIFYREKFE